jgi:alkanesulfonate monooxygenase SsuD/methylene tetrahydromethanopterin reductase-like flavin-dependent oxidoreductase (luciferase family)
MDAPLHTATEPAELLEQLGFETLWVAEHIAGRTKRIKIGCAFSVAPIWHPLGSAEDYAMADHLTDGRLIFGVGHGYHTREVDALGGPGCQ